MIRTNSLVFRLSVGALIWISGALTISGFVLAEIFHDHARGNFDRRVQVLLESVVAVTEIGETGEASLQRAPGEPLFDRPYSGWYWQIRGPGELMLRSRSLWDQVLDIPDKELPDLTRFEAVGPQSQNLLVLARDVTLPGSENIYRFAVAGNLDQMQREAEPFDRALGWSLGILWFGLLVASAVQIYYGLHPLRRIRRGLTNIRNGRTDRLEGRFPAEVTPLAEELNAYLGQISDIVERARTHVGNLAHSLKTPLSVLTNEAQSASGPLAETVRRQVQVMGRRVDHYLVRARTAATGGMLGSRAAVRPVLDDLARTLTRIHVERGIAVSFEAPDALAFRGDRQDFEEMAGNLMDNACKWAESTVMVTAARDGAGLRITVDDDGPGLAEELRQTALSRGGRLDESVPGTGLGLSIVEEIAALYGGSLSLEDAPAGGLRAVVTLPAAESV